MYYFEPQQCINNKQWLSKNQTRPVIENRTRSAKKVLYAIFVHSTVSGSVVQIPCKDGKTITAKFYKNKVLAAVKKFYQNKQSSEGLKAIQLIHDNESARKSQIVVFSRIRKHYSA